MADNVSVPVTHKCVLLIILQHIYTITLKWLKMTGCTDSERTSFSVGRG